MPELHPPLRRATPADARELAELVNFAGEGLPLHLWSRMAGPDGDPWETGRTRQAERAADGRIMVVDLGAGAVAGLTGYPIGPDPVAIGEDMPTLFRPLQELENLAPSSWYVNVLAAFPDERGKGYGSMLLGVAEAIARDEGLPRMSIIVADTNAGARRLYERTGYREAATRPTVHDGWRTHTRNWVLMIKPLGAAA